MNNTSDDAICSNCFAPEDSEIASKLSACPQCDAESCCSNKECQRDHCKAVHKQSCFAEADRMPSILWKALELDDKDDGRPSRAGNAATKVCCVCLDTLLADTATTTFGCADTFHTQCLVEVMKFDVKTATEACPMCQLPVIGGPEKIFVEASQRYLVVHRSVDEGQSSWSALPISLQNDLDAAIVGWHLAAEMGFAKAQHNLAVMYEKGRGVAQSDAEAARWFLKAAEQGHARAQCK